MGAAKRTTVTLARAGLQCRTRSTMAAASTTETVRGFDEIPCAKRLPVLEHAWLYLPVIGHYNPTLLHEAAFKRYKEFGPIVREDLGSRKTLLHLYDPADIGQMFKQEGRYPFRDGLFSLDFYRRRRPELYSKSGLTVMQGKEWQHFRSKVQAPILKPTSIESYIPAFQAVGKDLIQRMLEARTADGEVPDLLQYLYKWALESVCFVALDTRLGCLDTTPNPQAGQMIEAANRIFRHLGEFELSPFRLWTKVRTPKWRDFERNMDIFGRTAAANITAAMERLPDNITEDTKLTYLQFLLVRSEFSRNDAITMATDMMLGGVDTTSHSFSFLLFNLARNPQVQEKVYQELMGLLKHKDAPITPEILNEMRYLKACVKESMRISPIVDGTSRTLQQDVVMSGYLVPAGTNLLAHNMVACRQPSYFPEPDSFLPERWLDKSPQRVIPPNFTFLPFGFGPRMCVGRRIAEHEIWLLLAKIIMNFRVEYPYKEDIGMLFRLVNIPDRPLKFKFVDRD